jgi:hypothetical protein
MDQDVVLAAIGSTEPSTFNEFCRSLKDCPRKGDTAGWREVFATLERVEHQGLVVIEREERRIESLILTHAGADRIRAKLDEGRGLLEGL